MHSIEAVKGRLLGTVRLVVLDSIVLNPELKLSEALAALRAEQPLLNFDIQQLPPGQLENAVLRREADIGVSWVASRMPSLSRRTLFVEEQVICCGRGHPLYQHAPHRISDEQLETTDWVRRGYRLPRQLRFGLPPVSTAIAYHMEGVAHFILAGTHIGYLPKQYAESWLRDDRMRVIRPKGHSYKLPFQVITRSDMKTNGMVSAVRDAIIAVHAG